ncbi:MAG: glucose-6-phosphate isomerase [Alphaproteobacteria bacterium]
MSLKINTDSCLSAFGAADVARHIAALAPVRAQAKQDYADDQLRLWRLPAERDDLAAIDDLAALITDRADHVVVLGTGGSGLGGKALQAIAAPDHKPQLHFWDNLDPLAMTRAFAVLPKGRTFFVAISKSGSTAETMAQFFAAHDWLGGGKAAKQMAVITEPGDRLLRRLATQMGLPILDHDPRVGGRFAVLTNVGLLPARLMGLDPVAIREGADAALVPLLGDDPLDHVAPAIGAALAYTAHERGINQSVMMGYADRFEMLSFWYRQLWAESLGKEGRGTTPLNALGPVDQHSQLQLYAEGPADKLYTVLTTDVAGTGPVVPATLATDPSLAYLSGKTAGDLVDAEQRGTMDSLIAAGRPVRHIHVPQIDERAIGHLFMHFMIETILTAALLGVDPYDQPGVEDSKLRARAYLQGNN